MESPRGAKHQQQKKDRLLDLVLAGVLSNDDPVERYGELEIVGHGSTSEVM